MIVLVNGVFDLLHAGHIEHLLEARLMGDRLIVALTVDEAVRKGPGRPINPWADRALLLRELRCVDQVIPATGAVAAILKVKPRYFVKGIDYADGKHWTEDVVRACHIAGTTLRFTSTAKRSATDIIRMAMA